VAKLPETCREVNMQASKICHLRINFDFTVFGIEAGGKFLFSIAPTFVQFSCSVFFFFQTTMALLPTSGLVLFLGLLICVTIEM
jgi:hypothetical protein